MGTDTSNELPHFISNLAYAFPGNPALGQLLARGCNEHGVDTLAHPATTLGPDYGTLVPMRYMNADQQFRVVSVSALCTVPYLNDSARLGWAMRRAVVDHYNGTVAFLASGSLSHCFAQNGLADDYAFKVWSPFLEVLAYPAAHLAPVMATMHVGLTLQIDVGAEVFDARHSTLHPLFNPPD